MEILRRFCDWTARTRYPAVLIGLGLLLALPSLWTGLQLDDFIIQAAVLVFAGAACVTDLKDGRIPNVLTFGAIALAFV